MCIYFGNRAKKNLFAGWHTNDYKCLSVLTSVCVTHQRVQIVAEQGSIVDDIFFEDDKEEEESQQHVTEVTEDVVERTVYEKRCVTRV